MWTNKLGMIVAVLLAEQEFRMTRAEALQYIEWHKKHPAIDSEIAPPEIRHLIEVKPVMFRENISVEYYWFQMWLFKLDTVKQYERLSLKVNLNSFQFQKQRYQSIIVQHLQTIERYESGRALLTEIVRGKPRRLSILPDSFEDAFGLQTRTSGSPPTDITLKGQPVLDADGNRVGGIGTGKGGAAEIRFDPDKYGTPYQEDPLTHVATGTGRLSGPGINPDETLFHEMVHASRVLNGVVDLRSVNQGYENRDDFLAVTLTNIYLSEKSSQNKLRTGHVGRRVMDNPAKFLDNDENVDPSPRQQMQDFQDNQKNFFRDVAGIGRASFNPVRQFNEERK
jgi:hypothetical protein